MDKDLSKQAPEFKTGLFKAVLDRIRDQCDTIVNLTTSGLRLKRPDIISQRLAPVHLLYEPSLGLLGVIVMVALRKKWGHSLIRVINRVLGTLTTIMTYSRI